MKRTLVLLLITVCLVSGCGARPAQDTFFAMDTVMELTVYGSDELLESSKALISELEHKLSVTDEDSEIYAVNRDGAGELSQDTAELLSGALELCRRTGGALDITIYPVVRAWGFTTGEYRVPEKTELESILERVGYESIAFDEEARSVKLEDGMELDLGSVAKGYTGDRVISMLRENGVASALINLGGNVQALGSKPDGSTWLVGIQNPLGDGKLCILEISDKAVITSGGYERYFEDDGKTYWHIFDAETGYPADSGFVSVSVIGESGLVCDGLSTALFVMGLDRASELWRESGDFEAVFVSADGNIAITEGLLGSFEAADDYINAEVTVIRRG